MALLSASMTGLSLASLAIANPQTPNAPNQPQIIAQNNGICSFINANSVNVRSAPNTQSQVVTTLNRGDGVRAVRRSGNWVQISGRVTSPPGTLPEVVQPLRGWVQNTFINGCSEDQFDRWRR
ncbi:MAG TPA: SH3 domain-containing protein [Cyanobacteria bacterium UBA11372]|nr:SH3 domain-containing protein [Cyanobacteria bacterium UBA11372]